MRSAIARAGRRPVARTMKTSESSVIVDSGSSAGASTIAARPSVDLAHDVPLHAADEMSTTTARPSGVAARLPTTIGMVRMQPIDSVLRGAAAEVAGLISTARRMSCSWIQQSSTRMCRKSAIVPGPVGVAIGWAKYASSPLRSVVEPQLDRVVPFRQHRCARRGRAGPRPRPR